VHKDKGGCLARQVGPVIGMIVVRLNLIPVRDFFRSDSIFSLRNGNFFNSEPRIEGPSIRVNKAFGITVYRSIPTLRFFMKCTHLRPTLIFSTNDDKIQGFETDSQLTVTNEASKLC
jgi:hypothetical protein